MAKSCPKASHSCILKLQGLLCQSIVNTTVTKEMPYYRTSDGACVGILNIPSAFDCSATIATANRLCQCITVGRMYYLDLLYKYCALFC